MTKEELLNEYFNAEGMQAQIANLRDAMVQKIADLDPSVDPKRIQKFFQLAVDETVGAVRTFFDASLDTEDITWLISVRNHPTQQKVNRLLPEMPKVVMQILVKYIARLEEATVGGPAAINKLLPN